MSIRKIVSYGIANANPLQASNQRTIIETTEQFEEAVVIDVIVNNEHPLYAKDGYNVGSVQFRFLNTDYYKPDELLSWAFPLHPNISEYPLLNEIVYVFRGLNRWYYFRSFNIMNRVTSQPLMKLNKELQPVLSTDDVITNLEISTASPIQQGVTTKDEKLGNYFKEKKDVSRLKHLEGDVIFEGRSGHSIRFGTAWLDGSYTAKAGSKKKPFQSLEQDQSPNILIRIGPDRTAQKTVDSAYGQVVEDINKDKSSIWMVSDQIVPLIYSTAESAVHRYSVPDFPKRLDGNQIVINTDRLVLNTKIDKMLFHSRKGVHFTSGNTFTIDTEYDYITWTNRDKKENVARDELEIVGRHYKQHIGQSSETYVATTSYYGVGQRLSLVSPKIHIGSTSSTAEPLVLGEQLRLFLSELLDVLGAQGEPIVALTGRPGGPSTQNPSRLARLNTLKAKYLLGGRSAKILSLDNFTNRRNQRPRRPTKITARPRNINLYKRILS